MNFTTSESVEVIECQYTTEARPQLLSGGIAPWDSGRVCSGRETAFSVKWTAGGKDAPVRGNFSCKPTYHSLTLRAANAG